MREISAQSSYCGQNDLRAHFGLGDADLIDSVIITWPLGSQSIYTSLEPNQNFHYSEPGSTSVDKNPGSETGIIIFSQSVRRGSHHKKTNSNFKQEICLPLRITGDPPSKKQISAVNRKLKWSKAN
ncbi:MAG: ASPIC/UnbV domain-containing protein [Taibaiella sp.]|nr:ASPIC/UnbV domain-containing protein [Taibaiella sp.]